MKNSLKTLTTTKLFKTMLQSQLNPTTLLHSHHRHKLQLMDNHKDMEKFHNNQCMIKIPATPQHQLKVMEVKLQQLKATVVKLQQLKVTVVNNQHMIRTKGITKIKGMIKIKIKVITITIDRIIKESKYLVIN
jgi:hypothetical protein